MEILLNYLVYKILRLQVLILKILKNWKYYRYYKNKLFNYNNKDYILLSSDKYNEYSKLYEFKDKTPFIKNIYETNKNTTLYMIPWLYNNKYYIIECCDYKIPINNIFEDENYSNL